MQSESKNLVIIGVITLLIIAGGIWLIGSQPGSNGSSGIDAKKLVADDSNQTGVSGPYKNFVTIAEFADYQCPACSYESPVLKKIVTDYNGQVNLVFRNFPLPQHDNALLAALAAEAAGEQGKFWEMHDKIYENQFAWSTETTLPDATAKSAPAPVTGTAVAYQLFMGYAQELGLNMDQFKKAVDSQKYLSKIQKDQKDGESISIDSTPTLFVNGKKVQGGAPDYSTLKNLIDSEIKTPQQN